MEAEGLRSRPAAAGSVPGEEPSSSHVAREPSSRGADAVPPPPASGGPEGSGGTEGTGGGFDCNICLEAPTDPVVTLCGHLFCWACLYRWLRVHAQSNECPVCKAGVDEDKVVPLYGRGKASSDPRKKPVPDADVPNRPTGRRSEPTRHPRQDPGFNFFPGTGGPFASAQIGGFTVSAGFGLFPALFGWHFQAAPGLHPGGMPPAYGAGGPGQPLQRNSVAEEQNALLSKLLFALGIFVMFAIIFS